jgi:hypothetical protein
MPAGVQCFPEISDTKKRRFLAAFAHLGQREAAAASVGIDSRTHRYWMQKDLVYAEGFKRAEAFVADRIEDEIFRRGIGGWEDPVYWQGAQVGTIRRYSDTLLIFAAKGAMPAKYKDRVDQTHGLSPAMAALYGQWQALREQPAPIRPALPAADAYTEAEVVPLPDIQKPGQPSMGTIFRMLDQLNQRNIEGDTDDDG